MTPTNPKAPDIHAPTVERCAEIMVARSKLCGSKPGEIACLEGAAAIRSLVSDKPKPTKEEREAAAKWHPMSVTDTIDMLLTSARTDWNTNLAIRPTLLSAAKLLEDLAHPSQPTPVEGEIEALVQIAIDVLHHDTTEGSEVDKYEREQLRKKFRTALRRLHNEPGESGK